MAINMVIFFIILYAIGYRLLPLELGALLLIGDELRLGLALLLGVMLLLGLLDLLGGVYDLEGVLLLLGVMLLLGLLDLVGGVYDLEGLLLLLGVVVLIGLIDLAGGVYDLEGVMLLLGVVFRLGVVVLIGVILLLGAFALIGVTLRLGVVLGFLLASPTLLPSIAPIVDLLSVTVELLPTAVPAFASVAFTLLVFAFVVRASPTSPLYISPLVSGLFTVLSPPGLRVFTVPLDPPWVELPPTRWRGLFAALLYLFDPLYLPLPLELFPPLLEAYPFPPQPYLWPPYGLLYPPFP